MMQSLSEFLLPSKPRPLPQLHHQNKNGHSMFVQVGKWAWLNRNEGCLRRNGEGLYFSGFRSGLSKDQQPGWGRCMLDATTRLPWTPPSCRIPLPFL